MKFDTKRINEIPISDVVSRFSTLKRVGANHVSLCPWHDDHHPSMVLYEGSKGNRCHCFACGKGGSVIDYVMQAGNMDFKNACQWLSANFGIPPTDGSIPGFMPKVLTKRRKEQSATPRAYSYIPEEYMQQTLSTKSNFCQALMQIFSPSLVQHVAELYRLGMVEDENLCGDVIFWHIDSQGRVCNGKVQRYCADPASPRFLHCERNVVYWLGKRLHAEGIVTGPAEFNNMCLFGQHLLSRYPSAPVILVESAKNAIVGACQYPEFLWIATGSSGGLKREALMALRGRDVTVYPDRDAISAWKEKIATMQNIANFSVSTLCEDGAPSDAPKFDIADWIINLHMQNTRT